MAGVILIIQPGTVFKDMGSMYAIGLLCGLISGLLYACMILTSRYLKGYYTGTAQAAWAIIITLVIFLPYSTAISFEVLLDNLYLLILLGLLPTAASLTLYFSVSSRMSEPRLRASSRCWSPQARWSLPRSS